MKKSLFPLFGLLCGLASAAPFAGVESSPDDSPAVSSGTKSGAVATSASTTAASATSSTAVSAEDETAELPELTLVSCDENGAVFRVSFPEARLTDEEVDGTVWRRVSMPGTEEESVTGAPNLPLYRARLWVPPGAELSLQAVSGGTYAQEVQRVLPVPEYVRREFRELESLEPVYSASPAALSSARPSVTLDKVEIFRGWRLAHFLLSPLQFSNGRLTGCREMTVEVRFSYPAGGVPRAADTGDSPWELEVADLAAPNFDTARSLGWRLTYPEQPEALFNSSELELPRLKIAVDSAALYCITGEDMQQAGVDPTTLDPARLTLYSSQGRMLLDGNPTDEDPLYTVPVLLVGMDDGVFDPEDALYFWGRGNVRWKGMDHWEEFASYTHLYSAYNYYWLAESDSPLQYAELDAAPAGETALSYLQGRVHYEKNWQSMARDYNIVVGMDFYWGETIDTTSPRTISFELFDYDRGGGGAEIWARFKPTILESATTLRTYPGPTPGNPGDETFSLTFTGLTQLLSGHGTVAAADFTSGSNSLTFELEPSMPGTTASISLDAVDVVYPRGLRAKAGLLEAWGPAGITGRRLLQADDLTGDEVIVLDVTRAESLVNYTLSGPEHSRTVSFAWEAAPDDQLIIADMSQAVSPLEVWLDSPSELHDPVAADLIYISHPDLAPALDPLVSAARAAGMRVEVVRVDDIYDEYSGGRMDPVAIRNFIYHAYHDAVGDPLTFVTLVGDASTDYRDNSSLFDGPGWRSFDSNLIPTHYARESASDGPAFVANDNFYAALNAAMGDDTPWVALGRLSADSPEQVAAVAAKQLDYAAIPAGEWQMRHVLLSDNTVIYTPSPPPGSLNEGINFDSYAEDLIREAVPTGIWTKRVYLTSLGMGKTGDRYYTPQEYGVGVRQSATRQHVTPVLLEDIKAGALVASYIGHGAWHTWSHELTQTNRPPLYQDAAAWESDIPPMLLQSSCSVADFDRLKGSLDSECWSELLLWNPKGVIAAAGSTRLAGSSTQDAYHRTFFLQLFQQTEPYVGLIHQGTLLATGATALLDKHTLIGDAAALLRPPKPGLEIDFNDPAPTVARGAVIGVEGAVLSPEIPDGSTVEIYAYDRPWMPYTYTETRLTRLVARAATIVEDGTFSVQLPLPSTMDDDLFEDDSADPDDYCLELRAAVFSADGRNTYILDYQPDGISTPIDSLPSRIISGEVSEPADNTGPLVSLYLNDGELQSGDLSDGRVNFRAELFDSEGLLVCRSDASTPGITGEIDQPILLVADAGTHSLTYDLTDDYVAVPDDYTQGSVERELDLPPGNYTLTLICYDRFGEPGTASFELEVAAELGLDNVLVVPNPAPGETSFTFIANREPDLARIRIYTPIGRLVRVIEERSLSTGFNVIPWDGLDSNGRPLANGVYLYRLEVRSGDQLAAVNEKFIMYR